MTAFDVSGHNTVAQFIQARQGELGTTDQQIAAALGYPHEKVITMIKNGAMRVPLNKVIELAGVLDVDAASLLRLTLSETNPALLDTIERVIGPIAGPHDDRPSGPISAFDGSPPVCQSFS